MRFLKIGLFLVMAAWISDPAVVYARAGGGASMGSRGARTYVAPPPTRTAPQAPRPIERSVTPPSVSQPSRPNVSPPVQPGFGQPGFPQPSFAQRNPFMTGIMGGLVGAGIGGMLFGHGFGGGMGMMGGGYGGHGEGMGFAGGLGLLLQFALLGGLAWWAYTKFRSGSVARDQYAKDHPAYATAYAEPAPAAQTYYPHDNEAHPPYPTLPANDGSSNDGLGVSESDFKDFERLLTAVQQSWSKGDVASLRRSVTPEMLSYFSEQLSSNASRGVTNVVTDVKLEQGDLAESWREAETEYATVSIRFSALDYTTADDGRLAEGSNTVRSVVTETWTFMRQASGGRWLLSAIQQ